MPTPQPTPTPKTAMISFRATSTLLDRLEQHARGTHLSRSILIREILEHALPILTIPTR